MGAGWIELCLYPKIKFHIVQHFITNPTLRQNQTEIAKSVRSSQVAISRSISDLVSLKILNMEQHGRSSVYSLNSNSVLLKRLLRGLVETNQKLVANWVQDQIQKMPNADKKNLEKIILFGSTARNEQRVSSDIDIYAVMSRVDKNLVLELQSSLVAEGAAAGLNISLQCVTKAQFQKSKRLPLVKNLTREGVVVWGNV